MKKAAIFTLGCKVNQYESESVSEQLKRAGYDLVPWAKEADLYIVHTCAVTAQAAAKSRQQISGAHRRNPQAPIVVMGCYAQMEGEALLALPGVKYVVGTVARQEFLDQLLSGPGFVIEDKKNFVRDFSADEAFEELKGFERANHTRPMIKIQEGCNNYCSYCIIPYLRGPERSRQLIEVVEEAKRYTEAGYKELVLTGIHLSAWGHDFTQPMKLRHLLQELVKVEGLHRIRLSSVEPTDIDDELIDFLAENDKICRHLHIPLQSGCDSVLERMKRRYNTEIYRRLVVKLREKIPNISVSTDLIVGFPGETEEEASLTYEFCREMGFSRMHIFRFSAREGTEAATYKPIVTNEVKETRSKELHQLAEEMSSVYACTFVGKESDVLLESYDQEQGWAYGYNSEYIRIKLPWSEPINRGGLLLRIKGISYKDSLLLGQFIEMLR